MGIIKKFADRIERRQTPPETIIGVLRKGEERDPNRTDFYMPKDLDYFRYKPNSGHGATEDLFYDLFGPEPVSIPVDLPYATMEQCLDMSYQVWKSVGGNYHLMQVCDGETVLQHKQNFNDKVDYSPKQALS